MELLTIKELAIKLKLSISKIEKDMVKGLPHHKLGKSIRFDLDKVLEWYKKG